MKVGPDYEKPETKMPDSWYEAVTYGLNDGTSNLQTWWTVLNDPVLDSLIKRAVQGNLDLQETLAGILEARARLGIASGWLCRPNTLPSKAAPRQISECARERVTLGR